MKLLWDNIKKEKPRLDVSQTILIAFEKLILNINPLGSNQISTIECMDFNKELATVFLWT